MRISGLIKKVIMEFLFEGLEKDKPEIDSQPEDKNNNKES